MTWHGICFSWMALRNVHVECIHIITSWWLEWSSIINKAGPDDFFLSKCVITSEKVWEVNDPFFLKGTTRTLTKWYIKENLQLKTMGHDIFDDQKFASVLRMLAGWYCCIWTVQKAHHIISNCMEKWARAQGHSITDGSSHTLCMGEGNWRATCIAGWKLGYGLSIDQKSPPPVTKESYYEDYKMIRCN